jgi:competence protein ComEC
MLTRYLLLITGFVSGVCLLQSLASLPALWLLIAAAVLCFSLHRKHFIFLLLAVLCCGFSWANWRAQLRMADRLSPALEQQLIEADGYITDLPQATRFGTRFLFIPESSSQPLPSKLQLQWYGAPDKVKAGERWHFLLKLKQVHGQSNPGSFDLESWFLQQGIGATGTVKSGTLLPEQRAWLHRIRAQLRSKIQLALPSAPYQGVMIALTVGDQGAIPPEQWQRFASTGITHLISISGLHITLLAAIAAGICKACWRRIPYLAARFAAQRAALLAGVITALCYCLLAGMAVPTQRTLFMLAIAALCLWRAQPSASSAIWAAALCVTVAIDPFAVLSIGFWLSYLTVGALLWAGGRQIGQGPKWRIWISAQAAATIASAPILLVMFGQLPLVSPLANAFAIPIVSVLITPLALAGLLDPFGYLLYAAERLFAGTDYLLQWCSTLPNIAFNMPSALTLIPAGLGVMLLLLPRGVPGRHLGLICCLPLFIPTPNQIAPNSYRLTVLDVGQGLAVLVQTAKHQLLFDTGQLPNGERVLLPALRSQSIRQLDALVLSHNDMDHIGAAPPLFKNIPIQTIWHSLPGDHPLLSPLQIHRQHCQLGKSWTWDGVRFRFIWPDPTYAARTDNARGCTLLIQNDQHTALIPADIGIHEETELINQGLGKIDILLVPHHGSKSSSSLAFIETSTPRYAVFSAGYLNHYGHPKPEIIARYTNAHAINLRTDQEGALIFDVDKEIKLSSWRKAHRHYWQQASAAF